MVNHCKLLILRLQGFYEVFDQGKYSMNSNTTPNQANTTTSAVAKRPNETGSISVQGFVKIFDPATKQVFVEKRA